MWQMTWVPEPEYTLPRWEDTKARLDVCRRCAHCERVESRVDNAVTTMLFCGALRGKVLRKSCLEATTDPRCGPEGHLFEPA